MDRWKAEQGRGREKRKIRRDNIRRERVRRKKMQMREKVGKSRNTVFFQWFVAPEGRKVGSLKRRVRSQLARWEMKICTPLWREAHFEVKMYKTHLARTTFGSWDVEKVHAVVARSTFRSQNAQNTSVSDDFWKLRCRKSARRCGAKHISKSKCAKHRSVGRLLEVEMSKKCTPLWREAHFEVKMYKTHQRRTTFGSWDVKKVHAVVARSTFPSQNVQSITKHHMFAPLLEVRMWKKCTPLWREAHFEVKMYKTHQRRTTFGSWDVEKVHAVVARSTFPSQNVQNTPASDHFWKLRCRKSARRCGAKHISKSKCTKHYKAPHVRATFGGSDVEKVHTVVARSTFPSQNVQNTPASDHHFGSWDVEKVHAVVASKYKTLGVWTTFGGSDVASLQDTTLQDITLHYTPVHSTTHHYTTLHYTTSHYTTLHYNYTTTLHYTPLH